MNEPDFNDRTMDPVGYNIGSIQNKKGDLDMKPVSLKEIVDRLDFLMDEWHYYLNKKTGEIVEIQKEYMGIAEDLEDDDDINKYLGWEQNAIREAVAVLENWEDYVELPDKEEVNDYNIMEDYCYSQEDDKLRNKLC